MSSKLKFTIKMKILQKQKKIITKIMRLTLKKEIQILLTVPKLNSAESQLGCA